MKIFTNYRKYHRHRYLKGNVSITKTHADNMHQTRGVLSRGVFVLWRFDRDFDIRVCQSAHNHCSQLLGMTSKTSRFPERHEVVSFLRAFSISAYIRPTRFVAGTTTDAKTRIISWCCWLSCLHPVCKRSRALLLVSNHPCLRPVDTGRARLRRMHDMCSEARKPGQRGLGLLT